MVPSVGVMAKVEMVSAKVEEAPEYFDFTKNDLVGDCPGMAKLDYDPFPDKALGDVVRREIIARKLVLRATIKGDFEGVNAIRPGAAVTHEGRAFAILRSQMKVNTAGNTATADIEGQAFLTRAEPLKALAALRECFAKK
jgi:hypothetical protein